MLITGSQLYISAYICLDRAYEIGQDLGDKDKADTPFPELSCSPFNLDETVTSTTVFLKEPVNLIIDDKKLEFLGFLKVGMENLLDCICDKEIDIFSVKMVHGEDSDLTWCHVSLYVYNFSCILYLIDVAVECFRGRYFHVELTISLEHFLITVRL